MRVAHNKSLRVDMFASRLHDKLRACVALDSAEQQAKFLIELGRYVESGQIEIRPTAWDADRAPPPPTIKAAYPDRCAECGGAVRVGEAITYDRDTRRTAHAHCGGAA